MGAWAGLEHGLAKYNDKYDAKKGGGKFDAAVRGALPMAALGGLLGHLMDDDGGFKVEPAGVRFSKKDNEVRIAFRKDF